MLSHFVKFRLNSTHFNYLRMFYNIWSWNVLLIRIRLKYFLLLYRFIERWPLKRTHNLLCISLNYYTFVVYFSCRLIFLHIVRNLFHRVRTLILIYHRWLVRAGFFINLILIIHACNWLRSIPEENIRIFILLHLLLLRRSPWKIVVWVHCLYFNC